MAFDFDKVLKENAPKAVEEQGFNFDKYVETKPNEKNETTLLPSKMNTETALDVAASSVAGGATGVSYLLDLPQVVSDGMQFVTDKAYAAIFGEDSLAKVKEMRAKIKPVRLEPGKFLRDNVIDKIYEPKTKLGEYAFTGSEFAAPGGLLARGVKAKKLFTATGAVSGVVAQGTEDISDSEAIGTGAGVGVNIALDLLALRRGNLAKLAKDVIPTDNIVKATKDTQAAAKAKGLDLTIGEASEAAMLKSVESNVATQMANAKLVDAYYLTRPAKLETYIKNFGKDTGLIKSTFTGKISDANLAASLKKSASLLQANRTTLWRNSGGDKFKDTFFDTQQVDNLVINVKNIMQKSKIPEVKNDLGKIVSNLENSQGKGQLLHNVYKTVNDLNYSLKGSLSKTSTDRALIEATEIIKTDLKKIFSVNSNFANANKTYEVFTKAYFEPLEKFGIFKRVTASQWTSNMDTVGKVYRLLGSDKINTSDIAKIAKSFNKTGDKNAWNKIVSSYFDSNFLKAQASNPSLNKGINFYKALVGSPRQRANVTEMLYQVAIQRGFKGSKADISNAVNEFAKVLRASGGYIRSGSPTAVRSQMAESLGDNTVSTVLGAKSGIPIFGTIQDFFTTRTYSQNSKALSEAFMSPDGMDALIALAKNWKDKNASIVYTRNILQIAKAIEESKED